MRRDGHVSGQPSKPSGEPSAASGQSRAPRAMLALQRSWAFFRPLLKPHRCRNGEPSRSDQRNRHASAHRSPLTAHRSKGFTLIEMIAAFVIFAIAIGSLMQILTLSLTNTRRSLDETRAALWAQTMLDNVGIGERIEAGSSSGEFDKNYRWELAIEQIDPQLVEATAPGTLGDASVAGEVGNPGSSPINELTQMELYHVQLRVLWGGSRERSALFTTLRSALPDLAQGGMPGSAGVDADSAQRRPDMQFNRPRKPPRDE